MIQGIKVLTDLAIVSTVVTTGVNGALAISECTMRERRGDYAGLATIFHTAFTVAGVAATILLELIVYAMGDMAQLGFCAALAGDAVWITGIALAILALLAFDKTCAANFLGPWE